MNSKSVSIAGKLGVLTVASLAIFTGVVTERGIAWAAGDCFEPRNCIAHFVVEECTGCEELDKHCSDVVTQKGLAFQVIEVGRHDGYKNAEYWTELEDFCYVQYECTTKDEVSGDCPEGEYMCLQDSEPYFEQGFDEQTMGQACE